MPEEPTMTPDTPNLRRDAEPASRLDPAGIDPLIRTVLDMANFPEFRDAEGMARVVEQRGELQRRQSFLIDTERLSRRLRPAFSPQGLGPGIEPQSTGLSAIAFAGRTQRVDFERVAARCVAGSVDLEMMPTWPWGSTSRTDTSTSC